MSGGGWRIPCWLFNWLNIAWGRDKYSLVDYDKPRQFIFPLIIHITNFVINIIIHFSTCSLWWWQVKAKQRKINDTQTMNHEPSTTCTIARLNSSVILLFGSSLFCTCFYLLLFIHPSFYHLCIINFINCSPNGGAYGK